MRSPRAAIAFVMFHLTACTPMPAQSPQPIERALQEARPPDILSNWKDALQFTMVSQEIGNWNDITKATSWEWPEFVDYRLYYKARADEYAARYTDAELGYARLVSDYPLSIFATDAKERLFVTAVWTSDASLVLPQAEAWARLTAGTSDQARRRFILGRLYESANRVNDAILLYRQLRIDSPASASGKQAEARLLVLTFAGHTVEELSRQEVRRRADNLFNGRAYDSAFEVYGTLLEGAKTDAERQELTLNRGLARFHRRDYTEALKWFERAKNLGSKTSIGLQARFYHAYALSRLGRAEEATQSYLDLIKQDKKGSSKWAADAQFKLGLIASQERQDAQAMEHFQAYLDRYPNGEQRAEALWWLGVARYNQRDYAKARQAFADRIGFGDEQAKAASYWVARCDERLGLKDQAYASYATIASNLPLHYYGLLSAARLNLPTRPAPVRMIYYAEGATASIDQSGRFHMDRGNVLAELARFGDAEKEYLAAAQSVSRDQVLVASRALVRIGRFSASQRMIWAAFEPELLRPTVFYTDLWELAYPKAFAVSVLAEAKVQGTNPHMVLALMREESRYRPDVASPADAFGLLQLIMPTAKRVAKSMGKPTPTKSDLYQPELNIALGTAYIRTLLDAYKNNFFLAFAGYNGGPKNVNRWLEERSGSDLDEFVENIPYSETRNYVKKVTTSLLRYQFLYAPDTTVSTPFLTASVRDSDKATGVE